MPKQLANILISHFPKGAYTFLENLITSYHFSFKVTRDRKSKLGDFRVRENQIPAITVNGTLNSYAFLLTFLHELAHLAVYEQYGRKTKPHGHEWKSQFQDFLLIAIKHQLFPDDLLPEILLFTNNPKASTSASPNLMKALGSYDEQVDKNYLDDVMLGDVFIFRNESYKKIEKRRTRVLCERLSDSRRYTIAGHAEVELSDIPNRQIVIYPT